MLISNDDTIGKTKTDKKINIMKVPPRFELGSLDSKSKVLTITPWDLLSKFVFVALCNELSDALSFC